MVKVKMMAHFPLSKWWWECVLRLKRRCCPLLVGRGNEANYRLSSKCQTFQIGIFSLKERAVPYLCKKNILKMFKKFFLNIWIPSFIRKQAEMGSSDDWSEVGGPQRALSLQEQQQTERTRPPSRQCQERPQRSVGDVRTRYRYRTVCCGRKSARTRAFVFIKLR